ncbi:two-component regulator propeller domain-containing protein, partial [Methanoregula sp.]|uniref:two-component regulator propeller domain-containing protein n=1 Tax=Methanoregula sp. TaxID=2052170 RepID=UPI003C74B29E
MAQQPNSSIVVFILILVLFVPVSADLQNQSAPAVPYTITLFIPSHDMIHSAQITDMVSSPDKSVIISTSFGLSAYNGTWSTRHLDLGNISEGLMSDYITTIEFDADGNLWIGCPEGI